MGRASGKVGSPIRAQAALAGVLAVAMASLAGVQAQAQAQVGDWTLQGEAALTSDYILRGYSQSDADPAVQASFQARHRIGLVVGVAGSTADFDFDDPFPDRRRAEVRGFAGFAAALGQSWSTSTTVSRYEYPGSSGRTDGAYTEVAVTLQRREMFSATMAVTPNAFGSPFTGIFSEIAAGHSLPLGVQVSAGVGYGDIDTPRNTSFTYGHVSVGRAFGRFAVDVGYYDSDGLPIPRWGEVTDGSFVISTSVSLP